MQEVGIDVLAGDERAMLKKILESAQTVEAEVAALEKRGKLLAETEQDPRKEIPASSSTGASASRSRSTRCPW